MMDNDKNTTPTSNGIGGLVQSVNNNLNPIITSPTLSSTRTHSSPLMGTSARAAKRRLDGDTGPLRLDGTDTFNQQLQHHYQNVQQILEDQQPIQTSNVDQSSEPFSTKRDFFEQRSKSSASTYDSPPREQQPKQKLITTITTTTTTTTPTLRNHPSPLLNGSSTSINHLLEQAAELQKLTNVNSTKNDPQQPLVIERKEQYQVFLDPSTNEVRRTPSLPRKKTGHATDLDQAQAEAQADRFVDDHQAIQQLTRVLQEHNTATVKEYKRFPSQSSPILINTTTTTTTTIPSHIILVDRTEKPIISEFSVIDALLNNPLGTNNNKQNNTVRTRFNDILSNLQNPEYVNSLKSSITNAKKKKYKKKILSRTNKTVLVDKQTQLTESMIDSASGQTTLLSSKEKKKQEKENKKKNKIKSKQSPKDYQAIDAIISSPIALHLPDSYLTKYKVSPPLSQQLDPKAKNEAGNLIYLNGVGYQQRLLSNYNQSQTPLQSSEPITPRIVYRYLDEQGNVLKISSTPPSQLREIIPEKSQKNTEPAYFHRRQIAVDDQRHHRIPEREQRSTWQGESKLPTTVTREDLELRDKRIPILSEQPSSTVRTIPISIEREHSIKTPLQQQHIYHYPNQQNVQLNWLPLSRQLDQQYIPIGTASYDTDSTNSEQSLPYYPYDSAPKETGYRYNSQPLHQNSSHHNHSPIRPYYPSPSNLPYNSRSRSRDYSPNGISRNYIEVFRDGENNPSQVYSLAFNEPIPISPHHSRYDQYQSDRYGNTRLPSSSPSSKYAKIVPSLSNRDSYPPQTVQGSPNRDHSHFDNYLRQSKSFDYRPLHTKLQREYKITPNLLIDEWDHPPQSPLTDSKRQPSVSSPDEVFITKNRTKKA